MGTRKSNSWKFPKRIYIIFLVFILVLFIQYCYVSLSPKVYGIDMDDFASKRNTYSKTLYASRGNIYDSEGNTLATTVTSYTVIAYLEKSKNSRGELYVHDKEATAKALSQVINMEEAAILKLLNQDVYQVELGPGGRNITELTKEKIENLNLVGIDFIENNKRWYPNDDFASYIIGYAKTKQEEVKEDNKTTIKYSIEGEMGIELQYEDSLKGENGYLEYQQDRDGYKIPDTKEIRIDAKNGNDIYLTINSNIQWFVESAIKDATEKYNPELMMLAVMDAKTGDILAYSQTPSFDPNIREIENYKNILTSYKYEPGSTMKTYTYMCAIDKGTYVGNDTFKSGSVYISNDKVSDWNGKGWGVIDFDTGYTYSSNTGIVNILDRFIDKTDLRECLTKYGFGEKTNINLPKEEDGELTFEYPIEVATAGFGQGITITPIQQLQALTMIANNGKMLTPHIIKKIVDPNTEKTIYEREVLLSEAKVKEETITKIKELMYQTVNGIDPAVTGKYYKIDGFDIIGKTGTAEIFNNKSGKYYDGYNDYIYSFAGMYPNEEPEIIIYGFIQRPKEGSSKGLYEATKSVMSSTAKYLNMFPSKEEDFEIKEIKIDSYINETKEEVEKQLKDIGLNPIILGSGNIIINQYPYKNTTLISNDKMYLLTNGTVLMPNLVGYSTLEAKKILTLLNVDYEINGYGIVKSQNINPGEEIKDKVILELENK